MRVDSVQYATPDTMNITWHQNTPYQILMNPSLDYNLEMLVMQILCCHVIHPVMCPSFGFVLTCCYKLSVNMSCIIFCSVTGHRISRDIDAGVGDQS